MYVRKRAEVELHRTPNASELLTPKVADARKLTVKAVGPVQEKNGSEEQASTMVAI